MSVYKKKILINLMFPLVNQIRLIYNLKEKSNLHHFN